MKIQPVDYELGEAVRREETKPVAKSRLKRLFERQFTSMLRIPSLEKVCGEDETVETEPSTVFLTKMVSNYLEESNCEKHSAAARCTGRNRCNCFNGNGNDSSDDEIDFFCGYGYKNSECKCDLENLKGLVLCTCVGERNLFADAAQTVEKQRTCKRKDLTPDFSVSVMIDALVAIGYDASACKCRWEKSPSIPAGKYEFVIVVIDGERIIVDIDFRSQFEIARPTKKYKSILNTLPTIFVGKRDRLEKIIAIVSEAAKQSLKKRGMPIPPWRKPEYIMAKWFSHPCAEPVPPEGENAEVKKGDGVFAEPSLLVLPEVKPRSVQMGVERVSGLTSVIEED